MSIRATSPRRPTRTAAFATLGLALAACGGSTPPWTPLDAPGPARTVVADGGGSVALVACDGGAPVPFDALPGDGNEVRLELGGAPLTPRTDLYLPGALDASGDHPLALRGRVREARGIEAVPGRFGAALGFAQTSSLVLEREPSDEAGWSLGFWLKPGVPSGGDRAVVLSVGDRLRLELDDSLHLVVDGAGTEPSDTSLGGTLSPEAWFPVALVHDTLVGPRLRAYVNGAPAGAVPLQAALPATELRLGRAGDRVGFTGAVDRLWARDLAMNGSEIAELIGPAAAGEHALAWRSGAGTEGASTLWSGVQSALRLTGEAAWRRGRLVHLAAVPGGLRWAPAQWTRDFAPDRPTARTTHPTVYVGGHRVFVFSGEVRDSDAAGMHNLADTWIYELDRRRWRLVGRREDPGLDDSDRGPRGSCHRPMAWSPDHGIVLAVGGWRNDDPEARETFDETWVFHVDEERWELRHPGGDLPPAASDFGLVYHQALGRFVLFLSAQVYAYDPELDVWERYPWSPKVDGVTGDPIEPEVGGSFMCGYDPVSENVVLFGGEYAYPETRFHDHTLVWDHRTNTFTRLHPGLSPSPRVRSGFAYSPTLEAFVLFGGVRGRYSQRMDDLWLYRPASNAWTPLDSSNTPSRRGGFFGMAYDPALDVYSLLCGRHDVERFLDEAWRLQLDFQAVGEATYVFDRAALPPVDRAFVAWRGGADATVELDSCGGEDLASFGPWDSAQEGAAGGGRRFLKLRLRVDGANAEDPAEITGLGLLEPAEMAPEGSRVVVPLPELR